MGNDTSKHFNNKLLKLTTGEYICASHKKPYSDGEWYIIDLCVSSDPNKRALVCTYDGKHIKDTEPMKYDMNHKPEQHIFSLDAADSLNGKWKYKEGSIVKAARKIENGSTNPRGGRKFYFDKHGRIRIRGQSIVIGTTEENGLITVGKNDPSALKLDLEFLENQSEADFRERKELELPYYPFDKKVLKLTTGEYIGALQQDYKTGDKFYHYIELCITSDREKKSLEFNFHDGEFLTYSLNNEEPPKEFAVNIFSSKYGKHHPVNLIRHENGKCKDLVLGLRVYFESSGLICIVGQDLVFGKNEKSRLVLTGPTDSNAVKLDMDFFKNETEADHQEERVGEL